MSYVNITDKILLQKYNAQLCSLSELEAIVFKEWLLTPTHVEHLGSSCDLV